MASSRLGSRTPVQAGVGGTRAFGFGRGIHGQFGVRDGIRQGGGRGLLFELGPTNFLGGFDPGNAGGANLPFFGLAQNRATLRFSPFKQNSPTQDHGHFLFQLADFFLNVRGLSELLAC